MTITKNTPLTVSENDRITGSGEWDHKVSFNDLIKSGWELDESDFNELCAIGQTKTYSPNGRRVLFIKAN